MTELPEMPIALPQTKPAQVSTMLPRIGDITTIAPEDSDSVTSETEDIAVSTDSTDGSSTTTEVTSTEEDAVAKLTCKVGDITYEEEEEVPAKRRRVEFQDVTIYNFNRRQGYTCVPSQVKIFH